MASTDTRSGFRLPWSSDRSHDEAAPATETPETPVDEAASANAAGWPAADTAASLGPSPAEPRPANEDESPTPALEEPEPMVDMDTAVVMAPPAAPKRQSKLMADLTAAIRATAEAAREQSLTQVVDDVKGVIEQIRERSTEGAASLRNQSEEDVEAIGEWSKTEIERIREETESRITTRKTTLDEELAGHAAAVERRVDEVQAEVTRFESAMAAYLERLGGEDDPARLATMAEEMPEPPSFEAWADLGTLDISLDSAPAMETIADPWATAESEVIADPWATPEAVAEPEVIAEAVAESEVIAEAVASDAGSAGMVDEAGEAEAVAEHVEAVFAEFAAIESQSFEGEPVDDPADAGAIAVVNDATPAGGPWTGETNAWGARASTDVGDPVDRGAIMAALEADAEAVVAAEAAEEAAEESADQAEAAADVAETASGLLVDRSAGGFDTESFADRLASLLPNQGDSAADDEPRTTQVVVSGLVSVASIASFKRHLGRLAGVQNVAVASGPEGEFVFNLTHQADVSFRDAIPTMPGFAARVISTGDGVVVVTARDPEAEA